MRHYNKIFNPVLAGSDFTFAIKRGNHSPSYGTAGDCYSKAQCPQVMRYFTLLMEIVVLFIRNSYRECEGGYGRNDDDGDDDSDDDVNFLIFVNFFGVIGRL